MNNAYLGKTPTTHSLESNKEGEFPGSMANAPTVEFIGPELRKLTHPDRTDDRAFYMNAALKGFTKGGSRFVGMTSDEILVERVVR